MISAHHKRYVLLERDGVINRRGRCGAFKSWDQFEFLPRALDALRLLADNGCITLVVSTRPAMSQRGLLQKNGDAITRRMLLEVALAGGNIANVYYCSHAPAEFCHCHKPRSGLLVRAQLEHRFAFEDTFLVSDSVPGLHAAETLGSPGILIRREAFLQNRGDRNESPIVASDLYEAVEMILAGHCPQLQESAALAF